MMAVRRINTHTEVKMETRRSLNNVAACACGAIGDKEEEEDDEDDEKAVAVSERSSNDGREIFRGG